LYNIVTLRTFIHFEIFTRDISWCLCTLGRNVLGAEQHAVLPEGKSISWCLAVGYENGD